MGKIIAFSGSNSKASINQQLVIATSKLVQNNEVEVIDLRDYPAPIYGIDLETEEGMPVSMTTLKEKMKSADGFIVATPEHNGSMSALLKNTIDWLSRIEQKVFDDKPTVFMSTSPGPRGGASALEHLVTVMPYRGANIVGHYSLGSFGENYSDGTLSESSAIEISAIIAKLEESL